jgi:hypothetical protein
MQALPSDAPTRRGKAFILIVARMATISQRC